MPSTDEARAVEMVSKTFKTDGQSAAHVGRISGSDNLVSS